MTKTLIEATRAVHTNTENNSQKICKPQESLGRLGMGRELPTKNISFLNFKQLITECHSIILGLFPHIMS